MVLLLTLLAPVNPAEARQPRSQYTSLDPAACRPSGDARAGRGSLCPGMPGFPVRLWRRDGVDFVSVSASDRPSRAERQSPGDRAVLHHDSGRRTIVEWRLDRRAITPRPLAVIVRYVVGEGQQAREVLVVIKAGQDDSCHVAHVPATGREEAIALARAAADASAGFDCRAEPQLR